MADYSNLLASYSDANSANLGQDLAAQNRDKVAYTLELARQRAELKKKNGFWHKLGSALSNGLTGGLQQGVSGLVSTAFNPSQMLGGSKGAAVPSGAANGYAQYMAQSAPDASGGAGLLGGQQLGLDPSLMATFGL